MDKKTYKQTSAAAANGDTTAFARLYEMIYREMYYTAYYSLENDADAETVVLASARDGFASISRLRSEDAFISFMMKTLCARIKKRFKEYAAEGKSVLPSDERLTSDDINVKREFNSMPDMRRMITTLYVVGRFSHEEIAAFVGCTKGTVKKQLAAAFDKLKVKE